MRLILGIIIGAALTLGAAYVHDSNLPAPAVADESVRQPAADPGRRPIVNWDVLDAVAREQTASVKDLWNRAFGS